MKKVLFICSHNSARSQMAEGLLNHYGKGRYIAFSGGTVKTNVNPLAVIAMAFPDPSQATGTEEERLKVFRSIRDQIAKQISDFFQLSY